MVRTRGGAHSHKMSAVSLDKVLKKVSQRKGVKLLKKILKKKHKVHKPKHHHAKRKKCEGTYIVHYKAKEAHTRHRKCPKSRSFKYEKI